MLYSRVDTAATASRTFSTNAQLAVCECASAANGFQWVFVCALHVDLKRFAYIGTLKID